MGGGWTGFVTLSFPCVVLICSIANLCAWYFQGTLHPGWTLFASLLEIGFSGAMFQLFSWYYSVDGHDFRTGSRRYGRPWFGVGLALLAV